MPIVVQLSDNVLSNCLIFGECCVQPSNGWFMLYSTVRWLVRWVSISLMVRLCFFQLSNGPTVLCPTFQRLDNAVSNCLMVGQCCVQQSNGKSMLSQTLRWLASWVFNCQMFGLCFDQLFNGRIVLFQTVQLLSSAVLIVQWSNSAVFYCPVDQWLDNALSSSPSIVLQYNFNLWFYFFDFIEYILISNILFNSSFSVSEQQALHECFLFHHQSPLILTF